MPKPDRLKLLCFLPDLDGGGAECTIVNLVNAFVAAGGTVALAASLNRAINTCSLSGPAVIP